MKNVHHLLSCHQITGLSRGTLPFSDMFFCVEDLPDYLSITTTIDHLKVDEYTSTQQVFNGITQGFA